MRGNQLTPVKEQPEDAVETEEATPEDDSVISLEEKDMRKKRKPVSEEVMKTRMANLAKAREKFKAKAEENEKQKYLKMKEKYEPHVELKVGEQLPENVLVKTTQVKPSGKKKVKKIVYEEDSSESEEEVIVRRKPSRRYNSSAYQFSEADIAQLREEEIARRLKLHEERDEFAKLENEAIKRRYAEKLKEAKMSQFNSFMFPEASFKRR